MGWATTGPAWASSLLAAPHGRGGHRHAVDHWPAVAGLGSITLGWPCQTAALSQSASAAAPGGGVTPARPATAGLPVLRLRCRRSGRFGVVALPIQPQQRRQLTAGQGCAATVQPRLAAACQTPPWRGQYPADNTETPARRISTPRATSPNSQPTASQHGAALGAVSARPSSACASGRNGARHRPGQHAARQ